MKIYIAIILMLFLSACGSTSSSSLPYDMTLANEGYAELIKQNYDQAEAFFDLALSINPTNPYALLNLGVIYQNTGRAEDAKMMYQKVIDLNPEMTAENSTDSNFEGKSLAEIAKMNLQMLEKY